MSERQKITPAEEEQRAAEITAAEALSDDNSPKETSAAEETAEALTAKEPAFGDADDDAKGDAKDDANDDADDDAKKEPAADEQTTEEKIVMKYKFVREKIVFHFNRGCRFLKISKIAVAVFFVLFTLCGIAISHRTGHELQWLQAWILVIFLNVIIFVLADYSKYLFESKVIPYLEDDNQVEFGEYDIFLEDIDNEDEEEQQ